MDPQQTAQANFQSHIRDNPYPGRGLVVGRGFVVRVGRGTALGLRSGLEMYSR